MSENTNFPKTEKIEIYLRQDLACRLPEEKGERNAFFNLAVEHELSGSTASAMGQKGGLAKTKRKAASSADNGRKGGRPKIVTLTGLQVNAMKDGKMYVLMLVPMHVIGSGEKARYRLVVCHPGGGQTDAEYQPENDGGFPNIELLAEKNGFEPIDIRAFNKP